MFWPCEIQEVEQRVESNDQECNVAIGKSAYQKVCQLIKATVSSGSTTAKVPPELLSEERA